MRRRRWLALPILILVGCSGARSFSSTSQDDSANSQRLRIPPEGTREVGSFVIRTSANSSLGFTGNFRVFIDSAGAFHVAGPGNGGWHALPASSTIAGISAPKIDPDPRDANFFYIAPRTHVPALIQSRGRLVRVVQ